MPDQIKVGSVKQMGNIGLLAGKKIVQTNNVMTIGDQTLTQVRSQKTSPTGNKNSFDFRHGICPFYPSVPAANKGQPGITTGLQYTVSRPMRNRDFPAMLKFDLPDLHSPT